MATKNVKRVERGLNRTFKSTVPEAGLLYREWDEDDELTDQLHRIAREHRDDD